MKTLAASSISVIVSDVGMPGEDGYSFLQRVRSAGGSSQLLPALALTAYAGSEDRDSALAAGFQEHIAKPVDPKSLVRAVAGLAKR
jgi:CheY-like chemotaxis protein